MKKIHFEKKNTKKFESLTTSSSHSMAARMSLSLCNKFVMLNDMLVEYIVEVGSVIKL